MAGYSKTPLTKKLGIKAGMTIQFINPPDNILDLLAPIPEDVKVLAEGQSGKALAYVHIFTKDSAELELVLPSLKANMAQDGMVWISWPKKASKVPTDLNGGRVRELGLASGLVDVKVCAVDEIWSGHKFVYRVKDRR